jgi:hypothetical protein
LIALSCESFAAKKPRQELCSVAENLLSFGWLSGGAGSELDLDTWSYVSVSWRLRRVLNENALVVNTSLSV